MTLKFFKEPYPLYQNLGKQLPFILGIGVFIFLFLVNFKPFGVDHIITEYKYCYLAGYGVIVSMLLLITQIVFPKFLPGLFDEQKWSVGKQLVYLTGVVSAIIFVCYFYFNWYHGFQKSIIKFLRFYSETFFLALFPIVGLVLFDYFWMLRKYAIGVELNEISDNSVNSDVITISVEPASLDLVEFIDENEKQVLKLHVSNLFFLKSADNYVEVYYLENQTPTKKLIRNSLTKMEQQINNPNIVRCHRSFIVNTVQVQKVSGNAQGYKLHMSVNAWVVPVSRSKGKFFIKNLFIKQNE